MQVSFLTPDVLSAAKDALQAHQSDWEAFFRPHFEPPPPPDEFDPDRWPDVAEHVARAERVLAVVRAAGAPAALATFAASPHAIELATSIAAALEAQSEDDKQHLVTVDMLESLLEREIDQLIAYGTFLGLLIGSGLPAERVVEIYDAFYLRCEEQTPSQPHWSERVQMMRVGLADLLVSAADFDRAHDLFLARHREDSENLTTAITASRSFLGAGQTARSIQWLGFGEKRARDLGRTDMADTLAKKQESLRKRLS